MINKVICKDNEGFEDQLTNGEHYRVIIKRNDSVFVMNDQNVIAWYGMVKFEVV